MSNFTHVDSDTLEDWQVEDEETPMVGIQEPCRIGFEQPQKIKCGFALKRELFCGDIGEQIQRLIRTGSVHLDRKMARHIIKLMFDCYPDPTKQRWRMSMDGVKWNTYYQQSCDGSKPWENLWYNTWDFDCDNRGLWCAIENAFDEIKNPVTGEPMTCCQTFDIIGTGRKQAFDIRQSLRPRTIETAIRGEAKTAALPEPAREGFNPDVIWSLAIRDELEKCMQKQYPAWSKAELRQAMDRTALIGCPQEAFTATVQWEREMLERSAPNTWEYFNQEVVYSIKWLEKVGLSPVQPWAVQLLKGWPDGMTAPQADSCTGPIDAPTLLPLIRN